MDRNIQGDAYLQNYIYPVTECIMRHSELSCWIWQFQKVSYFTSPNLRVSTSIEPDALCAVSNRPFDNEASVLESSCKLRMIVLGMGWSTWITEFKQHWYFDLLITKVCVYDKRGDQLARCPWVPWHGCIIQIFHSPRIHDGLYFHKIL